MSRAGGGRRGASGGRGLGGGPDGPRGRRAGGGIRFTGRELRDLAVAWLALGLAFTLFLSRPVAFEVATAATPASLVAFGVAFGQSLATVGVAFLLHELAHKVVAVRFGQVAAFRADYGMLGLAIASGLAGFLFAAPGAVHHAGAITERENGLIAVAGPVTNLALAAVFLPLALLGGLLGDIGSLGVAINLLLAGFNMLPWGPLDGRKVLDWSRVAFALVFVPSVGLAVAVFVL